MWGRYDPKATQFVHIDEMPDLLHTLPKPFKVPKPNEIKIAALQLPVMEGGRIHCLDVLYALTKRLLGEIEVRNWPASVKVKARILVQFLFFRFQKICSLKSRKNWKVLSLGGSICSQLQQHLKSARNLKPLL